MRNFFINIEEHMQCRALVFENINNKHMTMWFVVYMIGLKQIKFDFLIKKNVPLI